jgi:SAM-dependent methyltransferase
MKQVWPAPERNKRPILDVIRPWLPASGRLLEVASGSGQHAAFFASELAGLTFQPSDVDPENLASVRAHVDELALPNLLAPLRLDVLAIDWGVGQVDAMFCANMIHIAPWECCEGLIAGAARHLAAGGPLILYGPYRVCGAHTAPSNEAFDARLREQNPSWGVRDVETVVELAERAGLTLHERVAMPANNQTLLFRR